MMDSTNHYHMSVTVSQPKSLLSKRSQPDMRRVETPLRWIDEGHYRDQVLQIPAGTNEKEIDWKLRQETEEYGINQLQITTNIETLSSSLSGTTIASSSAVQHSSVTPQSTAPTSCSSSDHRPVTSATHQSEVISPLSATPSFLSDIEKKRRNSGFRNGIRKMTGFSKKRRTPNASSTTLISTGSRGSDINSIQASKELDNQSICKSIETRSISSSRRDMPPRSPSIRSDRSSSVWSPGVMHNNRSSFEHPIREVLIDHEALNRTMECSEIITLRSLQMEQRQRFLNYQLQMVSDLRRHRDEIKKDKREQHRRIVEQQMAKNERSVEDLESRQLEEEMKVHKEHETEKRAIVTRLRHMEAYCQTPSPPPTPIEVSFSTSDSDRSSASIQRGSVDSMLRTFVLPERRVTDKDYHNLASCYRERDTMDNLQAAKINVLRGKQKRAVEALIMKKDREVESLEERQQKELDEVDREFSVLEAACRAEFTEKQIVLEKRWKLQAMVIKAKMERSTGLKFESLPYVTATEEIPPTLISHELGVASPLVPVR